MLTTTGITIGATVFDGRRRRGGQIRGTSAQEPRGRDLPMDDSAVT